MSNIGLFRAESLGGHWRWDCESRAEHDAAGTWSPGDCADHTFFVFDVEAHKVIARGLSPLVAEFMSYNDPQEVKRLHAVISELHTRLYGAGVR